MGMQISSQLSGYIKKDDNKDIKVVKKGNSYSLRIVDYGTLSTWKIKRFVQIIHRWFLDCNTFWNSEKYQSKAFTAAVLFAMTLPSLKADPRADLPDIDQRIKEAAGSCLENIDLNDRESSIRQIETIRADYGKKYANTDCYPIFRRLVSENVTITPFDPTLKLTNIDRDLSRNLLPIIRVNGIAQKDLETPKEKLKNVITVMANHLDEAEKFVPKPWHLRARFNSWRAQRGSTVDILKNAFGDEIENTRLVKFLRLCSQSVPNSFTYSVLQPMLTYLGHTSWKYNISNERPIVDLLANGHVRITYNGQMEGIEENDPTRNYKFKFKMSIECGPDMIPSSENCTTTISDVEFGKGMTKKDIEAVNFITRPFIGPKPPANSPPGFWNWNADRRSMPGVHVIKQDPVNITERRQYEVRDATKNQHLIDFGVVGNPAQYSSAFQSMPAGTPPVYAAAAKAIRLYRSAHSQKSPQSSQILGKFDVLQMPCIMNYDKNWEPYRGTQKTFLVHDAAAMNIGESRQAQDFAEYSKRGRLNEDLYIKDMGILFNNILTAQKQSKVKHAVWFPFGMGAFLRHLSANDSQYNDSNKMAQLRQKIAAAFVKELEKFPELNIHLCLPTNAEQGSETNQNYNAFIKAVSEASEAVKNRVRVYENGDATSIAQELATEHGDYSVSLVNGANRNLIGNHWFNDRALQAIDENLRRRSTILSGLSLMVNGGTQPGLKQRNYLADQVVKLGGKVRDLATT